MTMPSKKLPAWALRRARDCSGQSLVELAFVSLVLMVILFGMIDFGRAIYRQQLITNLSREGANLASRDSTFPETLDALVVSAGTLNIETDGYIILTELSRATDGTLSVTRQQTRGSQTSASKIGTVGGSVSFSQNNIPAPGQSLIVAEVFVLYSSVTPVGKLIGVAMPSKLYDAAFF